MNKHIKLAQWFSGIFLLIFFIASILTEMLLLKTMSIVLEECIKTRFWELILPLGGIGMVAKNIYLYMLILESCKKERKEDL